VLVAQVVGFTTREQLAEQRVRTGSSAKKFVRQSYSPGTNRLLAPWLDTQDDLVWRARAWRTTLESSGVTQKDRILHALPGAFAVARDCWSAALELGALSMGTQQLSLDDVVQFAPTVLVSTPTDALRLGQAATERGVDLAEGPLSLLIVTGEAGGSIGSTRRRLEEQFGARCVDVYQLVEAGVVGWGCSAGDGIHLNEDEFAIESIEPRGERPVQDGQVGELVITSRKKRGTPLVRYRTGDLVQISHAPCTCGSTSVRAEGGVHGRLSERLRVRGVELLPSTIELVVRRHPAVVEYRVRVYQVRGECEIGVHIEVDAAIASEGDLARVAAEVAEDLRRSLGLRLQCEVVAPGSLNDQDAGRRARRLSRQ
jgi:phenylacetate-CoA ligase